MSGDLPGLKIIGLDIAGAVDVLNRAGLVIAPTETVYGLAADASDAAAVAAVFAAKGRPSFNPLIAHVADLDAAMALAALDPIAVRLAEVFWPGPLTLVAPVRDPAAACDLARGGLETVAVRVPSHRVMQALLRTFGRPLAAPSANRSGRPSPTTLADALEETGFAAGAALEGGPCAVGLESTVVWAAEDEVRLLRPGGITRDALEAVVGPLAAEGPGAHLTPGRLARHYAPTTPLRLDAVAPEPGEAWLAFGRPALQAAQETRPDRVWTLSADGDVREAAANLFACLRAADRAGARRIAVSTIPEQGLGEAVNDRLRRAAGHIG